MSGGEAFYVFSHASNDPYFDALNNKSGKTKNKTQKPNVKRKKIAY